MQIWLIGAGQMAQSYARVLKALGHSFKVIGRGPESAKVFSDNLNHPVETGGVVKALETMGSPDLAIVAVGVADLAKTAVLLVESGTNRILLEKPGGLDLSELRYLDSIVKSNNCSVLIGYNRRFYASVEKAEELILNDGGALSARFEFTEWSHVIRDLKIEHQIKENWLMANSTHVIDLAFFMIGKPLELHHRHSGNLEWHKSSARFCGSGVTEKEIIFSYFADWESAGRWGLEVCTRHNRFILSPMEKLDVVRLGTIEAVPVVVDDSLDQEFKPGLFNQTRAFLCGDDSKLCRLDEQLVHAEIYSKIAGYS